MPNWTHPELGSFRFDEYCWTQTVTLPAFRIFTYRFRGRHVGRSRIPFQFEASDPEEFPSKPAVTIAKRVLKNAEALVPKVLTALHRDLHGKGPNSGMWWHGDIASVYEDLSAQSGRLRRLKLDQPEQLARLLGSPRIVIREFGYGYDKPLASICFEALFEVEHGIGILTNGNRIIGTGYEMDVSPFSGR